MHSILLDNIGKSFGAVVALEAVHLAVEPGQRMVLLGPSGSGKTTLLRIIAGLDAPSVGQILVDGTPANHLTARQRNVAMVFQDYALYPHLSVRENLQASLLNSKLSSCESKLWLDEIVDWFALSELLGRRPGELSGGQLQRVALAKAIIHRPRILLLDEPLSQLDCYLRNKVRQMLVGIHQRFPTTMIMVTHDALDALTIGTSIAILDRGRVVQVGSTEQVHAHPNTAVSAELVSPFGINWLDSELVRNHWIGPPDERLSAREQSKLRIGCRPEIIDFSAESFGRSDFHGLRLCGEARQVCSVGFGFLIKLACGEKTLQAFTLSKLDASHKSIAFSIASHHLHVFMN